MRKYKYPGQKMIYIKIYIYKYEHKYEMIIECITGTIKRRKKRGGEIQNAEKNNDIDFKCKCTAIIILYESLCE